MLLAHAGEKHPDIEVLRAEPFQEHVVILFGSHEVNMLVPREPFFLPARSNRLDLYDDRLLLAGLERKPLDTRLPEEPAVSFQAVVAPRWNFKRRRAFQEQVVPLVLDVDLQAS